VNFDIEAQLIQANAVNKDTRSLTITFKITQKILTQVPNEKEPQTATNVLSKTIPMDPFSALLLDSIS
jgi:hypothetical protein